MTAAIELYWKQDPGFVFAGDFVTSIFTVKEFHLAYGVTGTPLVIETKESDDGKVDIYVTFQGAVCPALTQLLQQTFAGCPVDLDALNAMGLILIYALNRRIGEGEEFQC